MSVCFCGCGRDISGIRRRASNNVAEEMSDHLRTIEGATGRVADEDARRARSMAEEGRDLLGQLTALVHEEVARKDVDKRGAVHWLERAKEFAPTLVAAEGGPSWKPDDRHTVIIAGSGTRSTGVIEVVIRDGTWGNDTWKTFRVTVRLDGDGAPVLERKLSTQVWDVPREGDRVEVAHDPADPARFVYRRLASPADAPA